MLENKLHFKVHSAINNLRKKITEVGNNNTTTQDELDSIDDELNETVNGQGGAAVTIATEDSITES